MKNTEALGPLFSVIVATYNSGPALRKTLEDILAQTNPRIEIVLIDGGSTDGSMERIADLLPRIAFVCSERDRGVADAYNKGIRASKGEWIYFLNADDVFYKQNVIDEVSLNLLSDPEVDLVIGKVVSDQGRLFDGQLGWRLAIRNQVHHQAIFYRASILRKYGYNDSYRRYGHDHEHNIVMWRSGARVRYIDLLICLWGTGGISDSANWKDYSEEFRIRRNTFGSLGWPFNLFTVARFVGKRVKRWARRSASA